MKTLRITSLMAIMIAITTVSFAQTKTEKFQVLGNCGMCKSKIEKAAKSAGAKEANWDSDNKTLTVKYKSTSTNKAKIQKKIAEAGYDNAGFKSTVEAYNKLHGCCKYDRGTGTDAAGDKADHQCCSDGKKCKDHEGDAKKMDCCKDGKCSMPGHAGGDCCKKSDGHHDDKNTKKMDCCKDGKCSMPGHAGGDCCKKS
jgi:periplasmic mercuric ion binding protein